MTESGTALDEGVGAIDFGFELSVSRLRPPPTRPGVVLRARLLERLDATSTPVIAVVAPAGFGKSTLLRQWAESQPDRLAWLTVDDADNEPGVFAAYLVASLGRVAELDDRIFDAITARRPPAVLIERTASWWEGLDGSVGLVVDNTDALRNPACVSLLTHLALHVPFGSRLLVAAREPLPWPAPRMRAEGRLAEFGARQLALANDEAVALLGAADVAISDSDAHELIARTEGWAAGLYLSALAIQAGSPADRAPRIPHGDHPFLAEYLRAELLDRLSVDEIEFLTRTSILDQFNGALCDAVVGAEGSTVDLEQLAKRNLMVLTVDAERGWYRYHSSFRDLLLAELERREPKVVTTLHRRAADWLEANGDVESAIAHAQSARDRERVVRLLRDLVIPAWSTGLGNTALGWLRWVADEQLMDADVALAAIGAVLHGIAGRPVEAEQWADAAERAADRDAQLDSSNGAGWLHYMRAIVTRSGPKAMLTEAALAYEAFPSGSSLRATTLFAQGMALWVQSEDDAADAILMRAYDEALAIDARQIAAMAATQRAAIAASADRWDDAIGLVADALTFVGDGRFDEYLSCSIVFTWGARVAQRQDDQPRARELLARATRLRPLMTYASPILSLQALLEIGRTYLGFADPGGARAALRQANDILARRPLVGRLATELDELRDQIDASTTAIAATVGASSLTAAELRLIPLLATHLTLREIGDQLYVSRNTVSTQTSSIYRKLGVSSRSEAIASLRELGLLIQ